MLLFPSITAVSLAVLAGLLCLSPLSWASADGSPYSQSTVVLGESAFDVRVDTDKPLLSGQHVDISSVRWIDTYIDSNFGLPYTLFRLRGPGLYEPVSYPSQMEIAQMSDDLDVPDRLRPSGYRVLKDGPLSVFLPDDNEAFFARCFYIPRDDTLSTCKLIVGYALDDQVRFDLTGSLQVNGEIPDFRTIAIQAHRFIKCELDVTVDSSQRNKRASEQILPEFEIPCEVPIS